MAGRLFLALALISAQPADAGCFLFFCARHHLPHHLHRPRVVVKKIVKKIVIVRERKVPGSAVDRTPITPLK